MATPSTTPRASFNGAATFRLRKACRHAISVGRYLNASMGPQPFGCGRDVLLSWMAYLMIASMGPQPFGCGRATWTHAKEPQ